MKKVLFLVVALLALSTSFGFSSNKELIKKEAAVTASYPNIVYHVGDVKDGDVFTVNFSGTYIGCSASLRHEGGYKFRLFDDFEPGNNIHIGDVAVTQNGQTVVYQIRANYKS